MTKFIFYGGGGNQNSEEHDSFYRELVSDIPYRSNILFVYFATRDPDKVEGRFQYDKEQCLRQGNGKTFDFAMASENNFLAEVMCASGIFFRGGSTDKLLQALLNYPTLKEALFSSCKTIAGSSAGAYALSKYFSSHYVGEVAEGLGIAPVRMVTHYKSETMPPNETSVDKLEAMSIDMPLIKLREGECVSLTF